MTIQALYRLHSIIGQALSNIEEIYLQHDLEFPSLDEAIVPNSNGHTAKQRAHDLLKDNSVLAETNKAVAAADHLIALLRVPFLYIADISLSVGHFYRSFRGLH